MPASDTTTNTHKSHLPNLPPVTALTIGSLGVVYGDIGTSPLYALRESLHAAGGGAVPDAGMIIGVLSLMLWSLIMIATVKYVLILLNADNNGEGGTLSLMALAQRAVGKRSNFILMLGIIGASLFFGDCVITPAISVLSAVEGLQVAIPHLSHRLIIPLTVFIITLLFVFQAYGTQQIARLFGPVMLLWFSILALMGMHQLIQQPQVLLAINPLMGIDFIIHNPGVALAVLGAVFLTVTGAEALYADLGHFGRKPIRIAWLWLVCPSLIINYFGQGALVLSDANALSNPFFMMVPSSLSLPLVVISTIATVIASQAVISGAYSMAQQAVHLGLLPRLEIRHTSSNYIGQIYMPRVNGLLFFCVIMLVLTMPSSSQLAAAYGISVTGALAIDSLMMFFVAWKIWNFKPLISGFIVTPFLFIELIFLSANATKFFDGAWVSLFIASMVMTAILVWVRGAAWLKKRILEQEMPLTDLIESLEESPPPIVSGTAVFLTADPLSAPTALLHNLKHNKVLHKHNIALTILTADVPRIPDSERMSIQQLNEHFSRVVIRYGFSERPSVVRALTSCTALGWKVDMADASFYLTRRSIVPAQRSGLAKWRDYIFTVLSRNAWTATDYFSLPSDRVVEIGTKIRL